ncbi:MAG: dipeptide epimerase [Rhodospirillaceae bacterium]|jgi:L-alanine-DL-glutamate epimerase-like enolase superfamily enzyme|nr:dipeptide epimerase [Rhodospirillaceae bacterium]MBT5944984.1 dipeptide epimerase [Rhodospirillaceae bacterium]MBT6403567.1 dipeptide epimerase [Rhodospirillaceae bacterium]MBT6535476.1 dipeptide epimerase [Rhodospirillaceae bacterium]
MLTLDAQAEAFALRRHFTISRGTKTETIVVVASVSDGTATGRGECGPNARYDETPESVVSDILSMAPALAAGMTRADLQDAMPPGAARNAIDCALWDYEARSSGMPAWTRAGLPALDPIVTAFTLSADGAAEMSREAAANADRPLLKLKLTGEDDLARVRAVRAAAANVRLIVDANEAWDIETYNSLVPALKTLGVELIEQPFPAGDDSALATLERSIPVCADEAFRDRTSLPGLKGKYDLVNIKLDKTGGLTEALVACAAARADGFGVMVGCMVGSSLAMAPAMLVAQGADFVDLDGPLLLAQDRAPGLSVDGSRLALPPSGLWG